MSLYMTYLAITTSMKSNLWEVLPTLTQEPWFVTTIIDFYFNIAIISLWVLYKERLLTAIIWIIAFICGGSITTALYIFIQLTKIRDSDTDKLWEKLLLRKEPSIS